MCFEVEGRWVGGSQRPQLMPLEKWKCRLGKENLKSRLSSQSQVPEGRSGEGDGEDVAPAASAQGCRGDGLQLGLVRHQKLVIKPGCK